MKKDQLYFLAIVPPPEIEQEIHELKQYMHDHYDSKAALRSPPHITLFMPFKFNEEKEQKMIEGLEAFCREMHAFPVELKNYDAFPPRVIFMDVIKSEALENLQYQLNRWMKTELKIQVRDNPKRAFHPHVTIAFRDLKKSKFFTAWEEFKERPLGFEFELNGFYLLKHDGRVWQKHKFLEFNQE